MDTEFPLGHVCDLDGRPMLSVGTGDNDTNALSLNLGLTRGVLKPAGCSKVHTDCWSC